MVLSQLQMNVQAPSRSPSKASPFFSAHCRFAWVNGPHFPRQEGGQNLEPEIFLITIATGAPLIHASRVIQALDEVQLDLVAGVQYAGRPSHSCSIRAANFSKGRSRCQVNCFSPRVTTGGHNLRGERPKVADLLLAQVGDGHALVDPQPLPERPATCQ